MPKFLSFSLLLILGGVSCSLLPDPRPSDRLVIASWNVENLFDEWADGDEYPEFDPSRGWTRAQFWARCDALAKVIRGLARGGPDLLVLEEIEGEHALETLNSRFLVDLGYRHHFVASGAIAGIKTAVLSRFPLLRTGLVFPEAAEAEPPLRPLVEIEIDLGGRALVLIGNHWKSRVPSPGATEALRLASAVSLQRRIGELEARGDCPFVVAAGDFNTSLELSRHWPEAALVSAAASKPGEVRQGLLVWANRDLARRTPRAGSVWDPWELVASPPGSYWYQGDWNRLDHAFVAASSLRFADWRVEGFEVFAYAPRPQPFGPRSPNGVSDHFPIVLTLSRPR